MTARIPRLIRVDPEFYQAFCQFRDRGEVRWMPEFQRKMLDMAQEKDKRLRFFR